MKTNIFCTAILLFGIAGCGWWIYQSSQAGNGLVEFAAEMDESGVIYDVAGQLVDKIKIFENENRDSLQTKVNNWLKIWEPEPGYYNTQVQISNLSKIEDIWVMTVYYTNEWYGWVDEWPHAEKMETLPSVIDSLPLSAPVFSSTPLGTKEFYGHGLITEPQWRPCEIRRIRADRLLVTGEVIYDTIIEQVEIRWR